MRTSLAILVMILLSACADSETPEPVQERPPGDFFLVDGTRFAAGVADLVVREPQPGDESIPVAALGFSGESGEGSSLAITVERFTSGPLFGVKNRIVSSTEYVGINNQNNTEGISRLQRTDEIGRSSEALEGSISVFVDEDNAVLAVFSAITNIAVPEDRVVGAFAGKLEVDCYLLSSEGAAMEWVKDIDLNSEFCRAELLTLGVFPGQSM